MKDIIRIISLVCITVAMSVTSVYAEMFVGEPARKKNNHKAADCVPASGSSYLQVNNVRSYLETSGSMWFKGREASYFVPSTGKASSMYAAALWIGGRDAAGQLKLAAIKFRQGGDDFWPGPLTLADASISPVTCSEYDKHFFMSKEMAAKHKASWNDKGYKMPTEIKEWPGNPKVEGAGQSWYLAPYVDVDGDGTYSPDGGDYPYYDFNNELCPWSAENRARAARGDLPKTEETKHGISTGGIMADQVLKGDQTLWWVFNDKGGSHTESKGNPIGLEIRAQAFGFATTDELNNMTFYSYEIINRSTSKLEDTYFSQWVDPDLGYAKDDYVGCDVRRGLGYCYNGKPSDGTGLPEHYGNNPPAVGVDFFQGPYLDPDGYDNPSYYKSDDDGIYGPSFNKNYGHCEIVTKNGTMASFTWDSTGNGDMVTRQVLVRAEAINGVNFGDGIVDNERYGMRRFVYHNNDHNIVVGDPQTAVEYYNFLRGIWRNNQRMTFGGTGNNPGSTLVADFMFPGDSDPCNWGTNGVPPPINLMPWTEEHENNQPEDRRFMQSAGPFTLQKGAINYITVGIPWARATGTPMASVALLKIADDKAQILFESCFDVLEGPESPDLTFREMDKSFICYITNPAGSTNYKESYVRRDPSIPPHRIKEVVELKPTVFQICDTIQISGGGDTLICRDTLVNVATTTQDTTEYDQYYRFEGYQIYQLVNELVGADELSDITKAQLVFQCDIKNGVKRIKNYEYNAVVENEVPVEKVNGQDEGITHSFEISEDKFGGSLVNYKKYYYMAVAYAYNEYAPYKTSSDNPEGLYGQKKPYLMGNKSAGGVAIKIYPVIPHVPYMEERGVITQSTYGDRPQVIQLEGQGNGGFDVKLEQKTIDEILKNNKADSLIFKRGAGPINVKVVDPLKVVGADFVLRFYNPDSTGKPDPTNFTVGKNTHWMLLYGNNDTIYSDTSISVQNEQFLLDFGISLTIHDARFTPLDDFINKNNEAAYILWSGVDYISASVEYNNSARPWMSSLPQFDGSGVMNWVRGGTTTDGDWSLSSSSTQAQKYEQKRRESFYYELTNSDTHWTTGNKTHYTLFYDKGKKFGQLSGTMTWAPYALASIYDNNPGYGYEVRESNYSGNKFPPHASGVGDIAKLNPPLMSELYSVDIVLTSNKDLWTRSPVVEISDDTVSAVGGAKRHNLRKSKSVNKEGKEITDTQDPYYGTTGMGWFPGYAICVETGERLNIMFGENSSMPLYNGADMIFNPTSGSLGMGGGHYIYIMGHRNLYSINGNTYTEMTGVNNLCKTYADEGKWLWEQLKRMETGGAPAIKHYVYKNVLWTTIPFHNAAYEWLEPGNDVKISLRVSRPYQRWSSTTNTGVSNPQNNNMPMYRFSTKGMETLNNQKLVAETYMDSIYVTPNPYYGMSRGYETSPLDTRVKFINLPSSCQIRIFTMDGTLIRSLDKPDDGTTFLDWDLKNSANIPVSSGMYLIHIKDNTYNFEKTLKFLCIQRPIDVNAF